MSHGTDMTLCSINQWCTVSIESQRVDERVHLEGETLASFELASDKRNLPLLLCAFDLPLALSTLYINPSEMS